MNGNYPFSWRIRIHITALVVVCIIVIYINHYPQITLNICSVGFIRKYLVFQIDILILYNIFKDARKIIIQYSKDKNVKFVKLILALRDPNEYWHYSLKHYDSGGGIVGR